MARDTVHRRGGLGWLRSLVLSVVLGTLLFVSSLEMRAGRNPVAPAPATVDCSGRLAELNTQIARVTAALQDSGLPLPTPVEESQGAGPLRWVRRQYGLAAPPTLTLEDITQHLGAVAGDDSCVSVVTTPGDAAADIQIGIDGLLTHSLAVRWVAPPASPTPLPLRVAVIIDDLGNDLLVVRELIDIEASLTFAVMPFRPFSRQVAERAHGADREVLLHLPMEAESGQEFGAAQVLHVGAGQAEVERVLAEALASVPYAVGVNNHLGSRFSRDRQRMRWVLSWLKAHELFYIDSVTTSESVAPEMAAAVGAAAASRSVFLDTEQDEAAVRRQLDAVLARARERGAAIGIGHPSAVTVGTLRAVLPEWRAAGVEVVPVSTLVREPNLAPH